MLSLKERMDPLGLKLKNFFSVTRECYNNNLWFNVLFKDIIIFIYLKKIVSTLKGSQMNYINYFSNIF